MLKLNVVGAGRCGRTLSYLLAEAHLVQIVGICNRRYETAQDAADFIGQGEVFAIPNDLPTADIWLIACSDDQIKSMVEQIFKVPGVQLPKIVFHCSGVLSSDILQAFQAKGCAIASAHPMHSFANPLESIRSFSGSYCALEGDEEAIRQLTFCLSN